MTVRRPNATETGPARCSLPQGGTPVVSSVASRGLGGLSTTTSMPEGHGRYQEDT